MPDIGLIEKTFDYWETLGHDVDRALMQELIEEIEKSSDFKAPYSGYPALYVKSLVGERR